MNTDALIVVTEAEKIYMSAIHPITILKAVQEAKRQLSEKGDTNSND
jgi:regulator of extracellular matrix RemA (YlzA/DUF370 family)